MSDGALSIAVAALQQIAQHGSEERDRVTARAALDCIDALGEARSDETLRAALDVYADPKHWAIRRNGTMYADCIWIGPGATDRVNPDGPGVARTALSAVREQEA